VPLAAVNAVLRGETAQWLAQAQKDNFHARLARSFEGEIMRANGTAGDFMITSKPMLDDGGNVVGFYGSIQDISGRKAVEQELERLTYRDPLTGIPNRGMFYRELHEALEPNSGEGVQAALLLLDFDHFKEINDSWGHACGDEFLRKASETIGAVLAGEHFFARLGGDEFAVLVAGGAAREAVERLAARLIEALQAPMTLARGEASLGASIGIAMAPQDGASASDLQRNADLALYRAKEEGRGRFRFFDSMMYDAAQRKVAMERALKQALAADAGLSVHYQPQIDLNSGCVTGFEALLRWEHPEWGHVPPAEFIAIAERSALIRDLGLWVLRRAAQQAKGWIDAGEAPRQMSVNVSPAQIWHGDFAEDVAGVLNQIGLEPGALCLELTESVFVGHTQEHVREALDRIKSLGVALALDDFGSGYSSLGYLARLPFDKIKIDRIFVHGCHASRRAQKLLGGIVALGHGLGMEIIAEGVEDKDELAVVTHLGCDVVQGYIFARPACAQDALRLANARGAARVPAALGGGL
jgi:diguanylate cyclase (GGDEF)-like protein